MNGPYLQVLQILAAVIAISINLSKGVPIIESDRLAFQDFFRSISSVEGQLDPGYIAPTECSSISDIRCDSDGYITRIDISDGDNYGTIPESLGSLSRLESIDLSHNHLTGGLPTIFVSPFLRILYVLDNHLNGTLPAFSDCTSLTTFNVGSNNLTGEIPKEYGACSAIESFDVRENQLTGGIPSTIFKIPSLNSFYANNNQLTGTLPVLSSCIFVVINVNSNMLTGEIPTGYGTCYLIEILDLGNNKFYGSIPLGFVNLTSLFLLDLANNQLTGPIPSFKNDFYLLDLTSNYLTGEIPQINNTAITGSFDDNCLSTITYNSVNLMKKSDAQCAAFCNTTSSVGPCSGFGVCYLNITQPTCICTQDKISSNADCIDKSIAPVVAPCRRNMLNPCRVGTCLSKDGSDDYTCICPYGYELQKTTTNYPTCISQGYTIQTGDTCNLIHTAFRLTLSAFLKLNPHLDCNNLLVGARVITVNVTARNNCRTRYSINSGDTCSSIQNIFKTNKLLAYNPGLNCSNLISGQQVCVQEYSIYDTEFLCTKFVSTNNTNCTKIMSENGLIPWHLYLYNPGIICPNISLSPYKVCIKAFSALTLSCTKKVVVKSGDTCASILSTNYGGNATLLATKNKGFICEDAYLYVGLSLC